MATITGYGNPKWLASWLHYSQMGHFFFGVQSFWAMAKWVCLNMWETYTNSHWQSLDSTAWNPKKKQMDPPLGVFCSHWGYTF
jgi:hypothetical protein